MSGDPQYVDAYGEDDYGYEDQPYQGSTTQPPKRKRRRGKKPRSNSKKRRRNPERGNLTPGGPRSNRNNDGIRGEGLNRTTDRLGIVAEPKKRRVKKSPRQKTKVVEVERPKQVYVDYVSDMERKMMAEAFAKVALLTMENNRLKKVLASKQDQLASRRGEFYR